MRSAQLAAGWVALCFLTAGGTYYGLIELDQQVGLQARLGSSGSGAVEPPPDPAAQPDPVPKKDDPPPARVDPPPQPPDPVPKKNDPPPVRVDPTPTPPAVKRDPVPVRTDPPPARPNLTYLQLRLNVANEQARSLVTFYGQREAELRAQGLPFRSDLRSALSGMTLQLSAAAAALRAGDPAQATRALDIVDQRIQFLEQAK